MVGHTSTLCSDSYAVNFSKVATNRSALSRTIDHINLLLRPKGDQQFSHSLCQKQTLLAFTEL